MSKIYYTEEVADLIDRKLNEMALDVVKDESAVCETLEERVEEVRAFRKFGQMLIDEMKEEDRKEEEQIAAWREKQEAKNA